MIKLLGISQALALITSNAGLCQPDKDILQKLIPLPSEICIKDCNAPTQGPTEYKLDETRNDLDDEGYEIIAGAEKRLVIAKTQKGLFYGKQTLEQIENLPNVPCCHIIDKPAMKMRAVMLDLARLKEKHEYYYAIIDQCAKWKINTIFLHLTDHSGCAIEIKSYPNLATKYAFTQEEMRELIKYAQDRYIDIIPEIEPWGHAKYITRLPELADIAEDPEDPRALCTSNPKTWEVIEKIISEIADIFPSRYMHAGCDEAAFGKCPKCKKRAEEVGMGGLAGEHVAKVCDIVKSKGKIPMVWADVILHYRDSIKVIPKDVIMCDWNYRAKVDPETTTFLKQNGYEVVGCPAIVQGSRMILPMSDALDNLESFTKVVINEKCLGMETTIWVPQRYIADTLLFSLAYACELSWSGQKRPRLDFANAFAKSYFGIDPGTGAGTTLIDMHELSTKSYDWVQKLWNYASALMNQTDTELILGENEEKESLERLKAIADRLKSYKPFVSKHEIEFDSLILAADVGLHVRERALKVRDFVFKLKKVQESPAEGKLDFIRNYKEIFNNLRAFEAELISRMDNAWDRWRYADDPYKRAGGENLQEGFQVSQRFMREIIKRLEEAERITKSGKDIDLKSILDKPEYEKEGFIDKGDVQNAPIT